MKIEIINYTKVIQGITVLKDINVSMESGKIYGFEGKNGSGKTMLMRGICGLITASSGYIGIDGELLGKDISFPRSVGAIIEKPGLLPYYSGYKNLKILSQIKKQIGDREIDTALKRLGIYDVRNKKVKTYSLGMKQKLGIAAAIMEEPDLLVLDEPFNGLDSESIVNLEQIIKEQKSNGKLVVLSCHDKELLEEVSDQIFFIENGRLQ